MRELRALLRLARPLLPGIALAVLLGAATVSAGVGLMATAAWLIATASFHPALGDLQVAIVGVRFFGISRGGFRYAERVVTHSMTFRLLARLRVWFYERLAPLVPARTGGLHSGDLLARLVGDIESLEGFFVRVLAPPLTALVTGAGLVIFLAFYGRAPAMVELVFFTAAAVGVPLVALALARRHGPAITRARAALGRTSVELVQGLADVTAAGRAPDAAEK
ncbi:MAG: thiol reductant ABC exporter subunit CydC, partial [Acidobacteria bacterium]|nr:thiol reductant ABC exporter subunit CydC [Acidobacteriota bacterium]